MQDTTHLGYVLVSIFPLSPDHPLQEVLVALSASGQVNHTALHTLLQHAHEPMVSPSTEATRHLTRGAAYALLGEETLARHELLPLLHHASDLMQTLATLLLGLLEMVQEQYLLASEHLGTVLQAYQRDATLQAHIAYPVLVWVMVSTLISLSRWQEAHVLLTEALEVLSLEMESTSTYRPTLAELYAQRGVVLTTMGCQHRGLLALHQAIAIDPANNRLYKVRGLLYMKLGSWGAAFDDLWRVLCHDSQDEECADALVNVLERLQASAPHQQ
ncbi:hypothetical protein [Ktedonospora formicarum]|uniref:Tetratricopeptide repeat protein n=1 Tax=Ktedonospora formicarum TaxID=2778364 RepID=A0A8J3IBT5_9CHLR|nr:hypothetical protein [Ktedonospora formicarum]GHO48489.1 hypothetical protein KSX_66520 [Ktedonospora formicarum]